MTTHYAQQVYLQARTDIARVGRIRTGTWTALEALGYSADHIARLERRLLDTERDLDREAAL